MNDRLISEWNTIKNNSQELFMFSAGSHKIVWWKCKEGHEWQDSIRNRNRGLGCPYCSGHRVIKGVNDLATLKPDIASEWHPSKNGSLTSSDVMRSSGKRVWWQCKEKHEWQVSVDQRTRGHGCPFCSGRYAIQGENDLLTVNPKLCEEWNYEKNEDISPIMVTVSSGRNVWWKCKNGHEWQAVVAWRTSGNGCPYCSNKQVLKGYNDLATTNPILADEWNYEKNGILTPEMIVAGSEKKVWWKCVFGHEWQVRIANRSRGSSCPYCSGRKAIPGENDLASVNPDLAREWNIEKNGESSPKYVLGRSGKKYWWKCRACGFEWQATLHNRNKGILGTGCPKCGSVNQTSFPEQAILFYIRHVYSDTVNSYTELFNNKMEIDIYVPSQRIGIEYDGEMWHNSKDSFKKEKEKYNICKANNIMLIRIKEGKTDQDEATCDVLLSSKRHPTNDDLYSVMHQLSKHITIPADIDFDRDRVKILENYAAVLKENSINVKCPEISKEWNYDKNGSLTPYMFSTGSNVKVWWKCSYGHEWEAIISSRASGGREKQGNRCPYCSGKRVLPGFNDLTTTNPNLADEWNCDKNRELSAQMVTKGSNRKAWWKCKKGHEWQAVIASRSRGNGCPYCSGFYAVAGLTDLKTTNPKLANEWNFRKNGTLMPNMVSQKSGKKVWWLCKKGHEWQAPIYRRTSGSGCPFCAGKKRILASIK